MNGLKSLSDIQREIVLSNDTNIIVDAGSGSGKTRVLTERVRNIIKSGVNPKSIVVITFTNTAANELYNRLSDISNIKECFIGTIHAYANKLLKKTGLEYDIFSEYYQTLFMEQLLSSNGTHYYCTLNDYIEFVKYDKLISSGRMSNSELRTKFSDYRVYDELMCLLGKKSNPSYKETVVTLCKKNNVITFDELIELATKYFKETNTNLEYLFVDELQDIGYLEYDFLMKLNAKNYFVIGDDYQCQPAGTKILMDDGSEKDISDVNIGDSVVSYSTKEAYYFRKTSKSSGKKILSKQISTSDTLLDVKTIKGMVTSYTPNHRCFARINYNDETKDKYVVYIMERSDGAFRVGHTKLFVMGDRNFGLRSRMNMEKASKGWILDVFDSKNDAWLCEQLCSYKYGIPQVTWVYDNVSFNQSDVIKLYEVLGNLRDKVSVCLKSFNRDINYPIFEKDKNKHFSKLHVTEVVACNLLPTVMDVAVPYMDEKGYYKNSYDTISDINVRHGSFDVFCLKVDGQGTYVADGILTHNSIFAFKGGDVNIFLSLMNHPNWKAYYLSENYRTSRSILMYANTIIQKADNIIKKDIVYKNENKGSLEFQSKTLVEKFLSNLNANDDWFILTRTNKEMVFVDALLSKHNIQHYCFKQSNISQTKLKEIIETPCIKVMTIHSSKGLECKNVALYGKLPIKGTGDSDELKVYYVGLTRAIDRCVVFV